MQCDKDNKALSWLTFGLLGTEASHFGQFSILPGFPPPLPRSPFKYFPPPLPKRLTAQTFPFFSSSLTALCIAAVLHAQVQTLALVHPQVP